MPANDEKPSREDRVTKLAEKIRVSILRNPAHFIAAGEHLDSTFDEEAVRQVWSERDDADLEVLDRVSICFARFDLAAGHYLIKRRLPKYVPLASEKLRDARVILLLTWLITDRETEHVKPLLSDFQNWPWGIDSEGNYDPWSSDDRDNHYSRYLARVSLMDFNGAA